MKSCNEIIFDRRSTKAYKPDMPKKEDIDAVIASGLATASGRNRQASIVVAVTNKEIRDRMSKANAEVIGASGDPFYGAPVVLVVLADKSVNTRVYDGSLTLGNMMLTAHELGLGSCWIHRAREVFEQDEWKEWLKSVGVEGEYEGVGNLVLGYADGETAVKERRPGRVYYVK